LTGGVVGTVDGDVILDVAVVGDGAVIGQVDGEGTVVGPVDGRFKGHF